LRKWGLGKADWWSRISGRRVIRVRDVDMICFSHRAVLRKLVGRLGDCCRFKRKRCKGLERGHGYLANVSVPEARVKVIEIVGIQQGCRDG